MLRSVILCYLAFHMFFFFKQHYRIDRKYKVHGTYITDKIMLDVHVLDHKSFYNIFETKLLKFLAKLASLVIKFM